MSRLIRGAGLVVVAGLAGLAGCGTGPAGSPGTATSPPVASSTPAPQATTPSPSSAGQPGGTSRACAEPGSYLTAVTTGQHDGFDRVVFQFSGGLPAVTTERVPAVSADPKGTLLALAGQSYLRVVFRGASATCAGTRRTWTGPSVLTPYYPQLLTVSAAGDFEGHLSFGIGLAAEGGYHLSTLAGPDRVVIDVSHVALGAFPGIWDITSWPGYWAAQYAWLSGGHQPWRVNPAMVVEAWANGSGYAGAAIHQMSAGTFTVTEPGGRTHTVTGTRPASVPGPWVITKIVHGTG